MKLIKKANGKKMLIINKKDADKILKKVSKKNEEQPPGPFEEPSKEEVEKVFNYLLGKRKFEELTQEEKAKLFDEMDRLLHSEKEEKYTTSKKKKKGKCPEDGCVQKKDNGKWGVISNKTGKFWKADYDTKKDAKDALEAYHANK